MRPASNCLHCGKPIPWLARLTGSRQFCSAEHARSHELQHSNRMLESLAHPRLPKGKYRGAANTAPPVKRPLVTIDPSKPDPPRAGRVALKIPTVRQGVKRPAVYMKTKFPPLPFTSQPRRLKPARHVLYAWFPTVDVAMQSRTVEPRSTDFNPAHAFPATIAKLLPMAPPSEDVLAAEPSLIRPPAPMPPAQHTLLTDSIVRLLEPAQLSGCTAAAPAGPALTGEPIVCSPVALARSLPPVRIDLRPSQPAERGIFIPRLRMSTLRPRMSLGPKLDVAARANGSVIPIAMQRPAPKYRTA